MTQIGDTLVYEGVKLTAQALTDYEGRPRSRCLRNQSACYFDKRCVTAASALCDNNPKQRLMWTRVIVSPNGGDI